MNNKFLINLIPGDTLLHKLTGEVKVRLFAVLLVFIIMSFDIRLILPLFILTLIALFSLKPSWKSLSFIIGFVVVMNLFNILLFYLANPNAGAEMCAGGKTVFYQFNSYFFFSKQTFWYLGVRFIKMITSFLVSLVFVLSITPSELAAGLNKNFVHYKFCTIVSLAFRYIPDIGRDYTNIAISMQARGVEMDNKRISVFKRLKQMVMILLPLIITTFDRVGTIANAMDLRGYGKNKGRTWYSEHEKTKADKVFNIIALAILAFSIYWIASSVINPPISRMWYPFD